MKNTLIIVPGWMHNTTHWAQAASQLPDWDVHVIDLPGFGVEPLVSTEWGVPEYAAFVVEKLLSQKSSGRPARAQPDILFENFSASHSQIVVLGHSFGGRILTHMFGTLNNSDQRTRDFTPNALILYAAPCLYRPNMKVRVKNFLARTARRIGIARLLPDSLKPYDLRQATDSGLGAIFKRSVPYSQEEALRHISVPTTLLWGSADTSVPLRIAEEMHTLIPTSKLETLSNEGHNIHLDNPTLFYGTLRKILAGVV